MEQENSLPPITQEPIPQINLDPVFVFPEDCKTAAITLEALHMSKMILGKGDRPERNRPVQSWELIDQVVALCTKHNMDFTLDPIYVQKNASWRAVTKEERAQFDENNTPVSKWVFDKCITRVHLNHAEDNETNVAIVISFHDKGITLAWGLNVRYCSNFNIYGGDCLYTFGTDNQKESYESVIIRLENWIQNFEENRKREMAIRQMFIDCPISHEDQVDAIIGALYRAAVKQAYGKGERAPFTINGMSTFVQAIMEEEIKEDGEKLETLDDLYNFGTKVMKPGVVDIADISENSKLFAQFLMKRFLDEPEKSE